MCKTIFLCVLISCIYFPAYSDTSSKPFFAPQQEEFLALNLPVYAYFTELYVDHKTPEQIAKDYGLSESDSRKYLTSLADIGIIEKGQGDILTFPIRFLVTGVSTYSQNGPLNQKLPQLIVKEYHRKFVALLQAKKKGFHLSTPGFWLTEKDYEQYKKELNALEDKYIDISIENKKSKNPDAYRVSYFVGLIPQWEPRLFHEIKKDY